MVVLTSSGDPPSQCLNLSSPPPVPVLARPKIRPTYRWQPGSALTHMWYFTKFQLLCIVAGSWRQRCANTGIGRVYGCEVPSNEVLQRGLSFAVAHVEGESLNCFGSAF